MNHYPHHIGDFNKDTRHLDRIERSIYRDLIELYYDTQSQISLDLQSVCRKIIANDESTAVERLLNEFFTETPTGWYHSRCEHEIAVYLANTSQKALAGKASSDAKRKRKQQALNGDSTAVERALNSVATAGNGASTNQNQNQEPLNTEAKASLSSATPTPPCPHVEIIELYAQHLPNLPQPKAELWDGARATALRQRWAWLLTAKKKTGERYAANKVEGLDWFSRFFAYVGESDFLTGRGGKWACDLGWLVKADNFSKVVQGNFENKEAA